VGYVTREEFYLRSTIWPRKCITGTESKIPHKNGLSAETGCPTEGRQEKMNRLNVVHDLVGGEGNYQRQYRYGPVLGSSGYRGGQLEQLSTRHMGFRVEGDAQSGEKNGLNYRNARNNVTGVANDHNCSSRTKRQPDRGERKRPTTRRNPRR